MGLVFGPSKRKVVYIRSVIKKTTVILKFRELHIFECQ